MFLMVTNYPDFHSQVLSLAQDRGFLIEAAQVQAKALLSEMTGTVPAYDWTYISSRLVRNISMSTFELRQLAQLDPDSINDLNLAARKFALVWQALAELRESTTKDTALLNAAVNYELAGYEANAMCIARQIAPVQDELGRPPLPRICSLFLQRRFIKLRDLAGQTQAEPVDIENDSAALVEQMGSALVGRGLLSAIQFFLRGDEPALEEAIRIFEDSTRFFVDLNWVEATNLTQSLRSLLPVMARRSTWSLLSPLSPNHQARWSRYLRLLARGVTSDIYRGRSIAELWPSQITALENGLLRQSPAKIVKMPTSAGKTRIAELAIVHTLINSPGAKCVYVAPYRALVSEVEQSFLLLLRELGYRVSSVNGVTEDYNIDDLEELLFRETDILVTTPEKLDLLSRARPEFLDAVRLFVLDEGHIIDDAQRGIKIELLLTRLKKKLVNARFLVLSAVVPQETLESFALWLKASPKDDIMSSTWRPSIQRYAIFEWAGKTGVIRYAPETDIPVLREFVPGVIRQRLFEFINPETHRIGSGVRLMLVAKSLIVAELTPVLGKYWW